MSRVTAYDGPLATALLRVFQFFLASVSFLACLAPGLLYVALVGWQPTHLALLLSGLAAAPIAPGIVALRACADRILVPRHRTGAGTEFWRSFAAASRRLWWSALALGGIVVVLGYDVALLGSEAALPLVATASAAALALTIGLGSVWSATGETRAIPLVIRTGSLMLRRPHIALSWLLLCGAGVLAAAIPVAGPSLMLFVPALVASAVVIVDLTLGFVPTTQEA